MSHIKSWYQPISCVNEIHHLATVNAQRSFGALIAELYALILSHHDNLIFASSTLKSLQTSMHHLLLIDHFLFKYDHLPAFAFFKMLLVAENPVVDIIGAQWNTIRFKSSLLSPPKRLVGPYHPLFVYLLNEKRSTSIIDGAISWIKPWMNLNITQLCISSWKSIMQHGILAKWIRWWTFKIWSFRLFVVMCAHLWSVHECWLVQWSQIIHVWVHVSSSVFAGCLNQLSLIHVVCCHVCALTTHVCVSHVFCFHLEGQRTSVAEWLCIRRCWIYAVVAPSSLISPVMLCCVWFGIDLNFVKDVNVSCKISRIRRIGYFGQIHITLYFDFELLGVIWIVQAHLILLVKIVSHCSATWFWVDEDNILFLSSGINL